MPFRAFVVRGFAACLYYVGFAAVVVLGFWFGFGWFGDFLWVLYLVGLPGFGGFLRGWYNMSFCAFVVCSRVCWFLGVWCADLFSGSFRSGVLLLGFWVLDWFDWQFAWVFMVWRWVVYLDLAVFCGVGAL